MADALQTVQALTLAEQLDRQECCQAMGGLGAHPSRCAECPRHAADELRRQHALIEQMKRDAQPVAWRVRGYNQFKTGKPRPWRYFDGAEKPKVNDPDCCDFEPLLSQLPTAPVPVALDERECRKSCNVCWSDSGSEWPCAKARAALTPPERIAMAGQTTKDIE